jgi:ATP-dependent DNA helicase PIF1
LGQHAEKRVSLPQIPLCPSDDQMFPFQFKRKQFPIRLSFAMTVNKSQGQTIPNVGVYLPAPVFSHGQLYVAISRATARMNIKILTLPPNDVAEKEEARRQEEKDAKNKANGKVKQNDPVKKQKRVLPVNDTYTKNIVYKDVLTL